MKILLIEDIDSKALQVDKCLRTGVKSGKTTIQRAKSFIGAVRLLQAEAYDLIVLDLMLPMRDDEPPLREGGKNVLSEILKGPSCHRPSHIICLTAHEDMAELLKDEVEKSLVHVVIYKESDQKWQTALLGKAQYVEQRLAQADGEIDDYNVDIAIVTSSPKIELQEVIKLPGPFVGEYNQTDSLYYYSTNWKTFAGKHLSVIACAAPTMGMTAACVTAGKVVERWRPRFMVMCGIAAGTKKDQAYGDILVAECAFDYGSGKIAEVNDGNRIFIPSPKQLPIDPDLHAILQRWEREQLHMDEIKNAWHSQLLRSPNLILGLIASGAAVVQSQELVDEILNSSRKVVGIDMEAYAIFYATHFATKPRPKVLVAKSISDFADKRKNDDWQQFAAFTSARFIHAFFTNAEDLELGH